MRLKLLYEDDQDKRVFVIHGWGGKPNEAWFPWLKKQLKNVQVPAMPETDSPDQSKWLKTIKDTVGDVDETTYFVGHSIGCLAILRYLVGKTAGGAVLVAPWMKLSKECLEDEEDNEVYKQWSKPIQWDKITTECTAIFSTDDPDVPLDENREIFKSKLGAKIIVQKDMGHFSVADKITELPVVMDELKRMGL
jgi:predicted alpha/beta hydrolase family esterase